jgi:hypothetical protein
MNSTVAASIMRIALGTSTWLCISGREFGRILSRPARLRRAGGKGGLHHTTSFA